MSPRRWGYVGTPVVALPANRRNLATAAARGRVVRFATTARAQSAFGSMWHRLGMATDLPVTDLRVAITKLLDAVEEELGPTLCLQDDFYWNVPLAAAASLDTPPELDLGSVVDDASTVSEFATRPQEFVSIWHASDHIAGVLRAIARVDLPPD